MLLVTNSSAAHSDNMPDDRHGQVSHALYCMYYYTAHSLLHRAGSRLYTQSSPHKIVFSSSVDTATASLDQDERRGSDQ